MTAISFPLHRLMLLSIAPLLGFCLWIGFAGLSLQLADDRPLTTGEETEPTLDSSGDLSARLTNALGLAGSVKSDIGRYMESYQASTEATASILQTAQAQARRPLSIYDSRITTRLGKPVWHKASSNIDLKLFRLSEDTYQAYALKVHLKSDEAMKMVVGGDEVGKSETTLSAVKRTGGIAGVNAGGYADDARTGKRYPLSNTIQDGKYIYGFSPSEKDLFFVGLDDKGKLVGGEFSNQQDLNRLKPIFGASFVPILLIDGKAQEIPDKWKTKPYRAARTVMANYKNDHLLFLVVDGRDETGRSGATLVEMQSLLKRLGAVDAYNLDGGGSSTLIVNGKLKNRPSDGEMRKLPTHFVFYE